MNSTFASIQNIRRQRQLELQLVDLDRRWSMELKGIARTRLLLLKELCRINQEQSELDHFNGLMRGRSLAGFTSKAQDRMLFHKYCIKQEKKFNFTSDPVEQKTVQLPPMKEEEASENGSGPDGDLGKVWTAKDLTMHRIQLQKSEFEQSVVNRRNRRRAFWDKCIIGECKPKRKGFRKDIKYFDNRFINNVENNGTEDISREAVGSLQFPKISNLSKLATIKDLPRTHQQMNQIHNLSLPVIDGAARAQKERKQQGNKLLFQQSTSSKSSLSTLAPPPTSEM